MSKEYSEEIEKKKENDQFADEGKIDIFQLIEDVLRGFKKFWIMILLLVSVSSSIFFVRAKMTYTPQYQSSITFIVNTNMSLTYSTSYYNNATAAQMAKTFPYIIMNSALQHIIADDLGMGEVPGNIEATAMEDTNLMTIRVTAGEPQLAYDILQSVIENYPKIAKSVVGETELNILDETGVPLGPINGDGAKSAAMKGFVMGAGIGCVLLFLYALTRKTIRKEEDLQKVLNVKCLGTIPKVNFKRRSSVEQNLVLIGNRRVSYGFLEANRTIRTRVERDAVEHKSQVYMVSSAIAGEGKTTVSSNLALSLADKGLKVLLVDLDLRNPSVHKIMGLEAAKKGTVDVLLDTVSVKDVIVDYPNSNLMILPGGAAIASTSRALRTKNLHRLFTQLCTMADYIIVDTPPSSMMSDAAHIVKFVDAGIFVVRQDYAEQDRILDGISMLSDTGLRLIGCILNGMEAGIIGYGYGYGYGKYGKYGKYGHYGKYGKYGKNNYVEDEE